ncbi:DUF3885 domain-containing protein [Paenibacillus lentus]|uniref:DUF3885 domain-containing protein n=1 Tax=Paenibacillus lentus TaxID=1338368 RepID=A0A3Q8S3E6_9BACL|nr:DUF3885 domain-containing protein [Paenibacillus lentus]AZK44941.1 DUF3885 domain-containing protein [Paenibacillus lentus]
MDPNEELNNFLTTFFENVDLKSPLFYNYPTGIRFDLASDIENKVLRTRQIEHRFLKIWEAITKSSDLVYFIVFIDCWEGNPQSVFEKNIAELYNTLFNKDTDNVSLLKQDYRYPDQDDTDEVKTFRYCIKVMNIDFDVKKFISVFSGTGEQTALGDFFIINETKKVIIHPYDIRGMDIISNDLKILKEIYTIHNEWILEFDRDKIDKIFKPKE